MYPHFRKTWSKTTKNYIYSVVVECDNEEEMIPSFVSLWIHTRLEGLNKYTYKYALVFNIQEKSYRINAIRYDDLFKFILAASRRVKSKVAMDKFINTCAEVSMSACFGSTLSLKLTSTVASNLTVEVSFTKAAASSIV